MRTFEEKQRIHGEIIDRQKELVEQVENLAWKQAQPGCKTSERQARINKLAAEYKALDEKRIANWS